MDKDRKCICNGAAQPIQLYGTDLKDFLQRDLVITAVPFKIDNNHGFVSLSRDIPILARLKKRCNVI
jgi:hypothetical protein